ncbi:MAG: hypothetical protein GY934_16295 [Gammaproteobacteria bacterium]|nr:hypothetical protein [Gammaproteobacteria bacterium]
MSIQRNKEIETLKTRLAALEAEQEREQLIQTALDKARENLLSTLKEAGVSFDEFVRFSYKDIRKVVNKIEREKAKQSIETKPQQKVTKKSVKKGRRVKAAKTTVKIPAGQYTGVPGEPDKVFSVKEKGPRPKALKAYAEEVGLEVLLSQHLVAE